MNVRLTILLAVVALMIGATWAIIEFTDVVFREDPDPDEPWLYHIDETDITFIEVIHDGNGVQYERDSGSHQWRIIGDPDYPVFQQQVGRHSTVAERTESQQGTERDDQRSRPVRT